MIATTEHGTPVDLSEASASRYPTTVTTTVTYLHASVGVYTPAPGGGQWCNTAVCTHNHPDTDHGRLAVTMCARRLTRIIEQGRLPKWATLV